MARNDGQPAGRQVTFDDVEVGAARGTGAHTDPHLAGTRVRHHQLGGLERSVRYRPLNADDHRAHRKHSQSDAAAQRKRQPCRRSGARRRSRPAPPPDTRPVDGVRARLDRDLFGVRPVGERFAEHAAVDALAVVEPSSAAVGVTSTLPAGTVTVPPACSRCRGEQRVADVPWAQAPLSLVKMVRVAGDGGGSVPGMPYAFAAEVDGNVIRMSGLWRHSLRG